jgi:hypothetical protein
MSFYSKLKADAEKFKAEILKVAGDVPAVAAKITEYTPEVESLVALAFPQAAPIEAGAVAVVDAIESVVSKAGSAASVNGLSAVQDQGVIAAVESVIAAIKKI